MFSSPKVIGQIEPTRATSGQPEEPEERIAQFMLFLRLFKSGNAGCNSVRFSAMQWMATYSVHTSSGLYGKPYFGLAYSVDAKEARDLEDSWNSFRELLSPRHLSNRKYLQIAFDRFTSSYTRDRYEDKFVDYVSSLEALYLEESQELGYRLALRVATLLGDTPEKKVEIFDAVKKAYKIRSSVVHGKPLEPIRIKGERKSLSDILALFEDYTRQSLKRFLRLSTKYLEQTEILDELDKAILNQYLARGLQS